MKGAVPVALPPFSYTAVIVLIRALVQVGRGTGVHTNISLG